MEDQFEDKTKYWHCKGGGGNKTSVYQHTGHAVADLVEAPHYKPEGRSFDSRWCHWNFSLT